MIHSSSEKTLCLQFFSHDSDGSLMATSTEDFGTSTDGFKEFRDFHDFFWNSKDMMNVKDAETLKGKQTS